MCHATREPSGVSTFFLSNAAWLGKKKGACHLNRTWHSSCIDLGRFLPLQKALGLHLFWTLRPSSEKNLPFLNPAPMKHFSWIFFFGGGGSSPIFLRQIIFYLLLVEGSEGTVGNPAIFFCEQPRARPANAQQQQQDLALRPPCPTYNSRMAEVLICACQNGLVLPLISWEKWDWDHITPNLGSIYLV